MNRDHVHDGAEENNRFKFAFRTSRQPLARSSAKASKTSRYRLFGSIACALLVLVGVMVVIEVVNVNRVLAQGAGGNAVLRVIKIVDNTGTTSLLSPSRFQLSIAKEGADPLFSFAGSELGTSIGVNIDTAIGGTTFIVDELNSPGNYLITFSGDCDGTGRVTILSGEIRTCVVTDTFIASRNRMGSSNAVLRVIKHVDNSTDSSGRILPSASDFSLDVLGLSFLPLLTISGAEEGTAIGLQGSFGTYNVRESF